MNAFVSGLAFPGVQLEYQTLASLVNPRTPQVFEFGSDTLGVFYTMELLEGEDLRASAPMAWRTVCDCVRDASQALGMLHARGLIHRDVSPRNLWRTPETELSPAEVPWNLIQEGTRKYRMLVLVTADGNLVALAALGREEVAPAACRAALLRGIADRLYDAISEERTERSSILI